MRKLLLAIVILCAVAASLVFFRSKPTSAELPKLVGATSQTNDVKPSATAVASAPKTISRPPRQPNLAPRAGFLDSDIMVAVRKAVESGDRVALDGAYQSLVEYLRAHPENIDDYIAEDVLRSLSRAIAESDALWGEKLSAAASELAKDSSFQQRQHMMLHLIGQFPEIGKDVHDAVIDVANQDPDSQVKTSAVVALADWIEKFPEQTVALLDEVAKVFNTAKDEDVLAFTYQVLALHKEKLSREMHAALADRLQKENNQYLRVPMVTALSAAPADIRDQTASYLNSLFNTHTDLEMKRDDLAQIVALTKEASEPLLRTLVNRGDRLAQDAMDYLSLISVGPLDAETIFNQKATRDVAQNGEKHGD